MILHPNKLKTFDAEPDNFGILCKGRSIEKLGEIESHFQDCFLVNNFDPEIEKIGRFLENKRIVHCVNRLLTAPLKPLNYIKLNISEVLLSKSSLFWDRLLLRVFIHYKRLGLSPVFLPPKFLALSNELFGSEGLNKFPNTGLLALIYTLSVIRPKNLWIAGLDFYQQDYLIRRPHQDPLQKQQQRMDEIGAIDVFHRLVSKSHDTTFYMLSYYDGFKAFPNLRCL